MAKRVVRKMKNIESTPTQKKMSHEIPVVGISSEDMKTLNSPMKKGNTNENQFTF